MEADLTIIGMREGRNILGLVAILKDTGVGSSQDEGKGGPP